MTSSEKFWDLIFFFHSSFIPKELHGKLNHGVVDPSLPLWAPRPSWAVSSELSDAGILSEAGIRRRVSGCSASHASPPLVPSEKVHAVVVRGSRRLDVVLGKKTRTARQVSKQPAYNVIIIYIIINNIFIIY